MKNRLSLYNTYTGQWGPDDCGLACLSMLLKYAGRYEDSERLLRSGPVKPSGLSLLEMREIATACQLKSRCVQMDKPTLRGLNCPCILHVVKYGNAYHFVVCYSARYRRGSWKYLIGDPATGMAWFAETELDEIWLEGAALYFENLNYKRMGLTGHTWYALLEAVSLHKILLISIPLLNIFLTLLGVALSWLLQRGINDSLTDRKFSLLTAVVILLLVILLARSCGNYLKQQLLIKLNSDIRHKYTSLLWEQFSFRGQDNVRVRKVLSDIQQIQNAVTALFAVLFSEGSLVMLLITGLWYLDSLTGLIITLYLGIAIVIGLYHSASLTWRQSVLNEFALSAENAMILAVGGTGAGEPLPDEPLHEQHKYAQLAKSQAVNIGRVILWYECTGALAVICILYLCLFDVRQGHISYTMLMTEVIVSYFVTVLTPRICQVFPVITEGARLSRRFEKIS